jgi:hypothetical protein
MVAMVSLGLIIWAGTAFALFADNHRSDTSLVIVPPVFGTEAAR